MAEGAGNTILRLAPRALTLKDGRVSKCHGIGTLILALQDLERQAEERGQTTTTFYNASWGGVEVALCEGVDGKLYLQVDGFNE